MAELERLGVRSVPVLSRGDKYTFGQSTKQIVDFLGLTEKSGPDSRPTSWRRVSPSSWMPPSN